MFDGWCIFILCNYSFVVVGVVGVVGVVENVEDILDGTELAVDTEIEIVDIVLDLAVVNKVYFDNSIDYCEYVGFVYNLDFCCFSFGFDLAVE